MIKIKLLAQMVKRPLSSMREVSGYPDSPAIVYFGQNNNKNVFPSV